MEDVISEWLQKILSFIDDRSFPIQDAGRRQARTNGEGMPNHLTRFLHDFSTRESIHMQVETSTIQFNHVLTPYFAVRMGFF
jgi:hypothetical protein